MSDKIGKWLTRDGRTAVVFAECNEIQVGAILKDGHVISTSWEQCSSFGHSSNDLIRRVSDSTDLTPYVPVKRVRPWTRAEVEAIVQQRPLWVRKISGGYSGQVIEIIDSGVYLNGTHWRFDDAMERLEQFDGSPCGVEVEE